MKGMLLVSVVFSAQVYAQNKFVFSGSDTLAGVMSDAIINAGMENQMQYAGGGSGVGEKGLIAGDQAIAPMSREINQEASDKLKSAGVQVIPHVIALDGLSVFVNSKNTAKAMDLQTITRVFTCEFTKWEQIPGSGKSGAIKAYRRNDQALRPLAPVLQFWPRPLTLRT